MNNERYNQIIDEVYENYLGGGHIKWLKPREYDTPMGKINVPTPYSKEEFINKCKTDPEFSKKWGLKIEERELSQRERVKLLQESWKNNGIGAGDEEVSTLWVEYNNLMTKYNIPSKLITITYKDETIEIYE